MINNGDLDFRLLQVFVVLMRTRNLSRAAEELGLSQSTLSHALMRLRRNLNNPLFIRTSKGMEPTPRAEEVAPAVRAMLDLYESHIAGPRAFDPATSDRMFTFVGSDAGEAVLMPPLLKRLRQEAPHLRFKAQPLIGSAVARQLEEGQVDFVFGGYPDLEVGVHESPLYRETYICMARKDHPLVTTGVTLESFSTALHIVVSTHLSGHAHRRAEQTLLQALPEECVKVVSQSFLLSALLLEGSDCVLTVPTAVALAMNGVGRFAVFRPPIDLPGFDVKLYWHERLHRDAGHQWMRALIRSMFSVGLPDPIALAEGA
jgi:DNA-binding transcriptional LysR family regulator